MFILTIVKRHLVYVCVCMFACCIHCMFTSDLNEGVCMCAVVFAVHIYCDYKVSIAPVEKFI